jgi:hypothetical protein
MNKTRNFITRYWRLLAIVSGIALLAYILLFRQLIVLTGGYYSLGGQASQIQSSGLRTILNNPVNAPYKLLVWVTIKLGHHGLINTRIAASLIAIGIAVLFYWVAVHWYSKRIAVLSSIMFVSSSGFLHFGRYGSALILQMATVLLISCVLLYRRAKNETVATYLLVGLLTLCLYIPGMFWFEIFGLVLLYKQIWRHVKRLGLSHSIVLITLNLGMLIPVVWASLHNIGSLRELLALPTSFPSLSQIAENAKQLGEALFYRGYYSSEYWLYGAPLLNIIEIALLIIGLVVASRRPLLRGNYYVLGALLISIILVLLGGTATIAMLVPLLYLIIAGGIFYILDQWLTIFPKNPIARAIGIALICIMAVFSAFYHTRAYYIAWPKAPETKQVYTIKS